MFNPQGEIGYYPECFGGSYTTMLVQINNSSFRQATAISSNVASRFQSSQIGPQVSTNLTGIAAGDKTKSWNVWGNLTDNNNSQSYQYIDRSITKNDSNILTTVLGADLSISPDMVVGISTSFDRGNVSGNNNMSIFVPENKVLSEGYVVAPYIGWQINNLLTLDASAGVGQGKLNMSGGVTAEADRWFAATNLSYNRWIDNIQLTGKLGYLHGTEKYGASKTPLFLPIGLPTMIDSVAGTASKNSIDQMHLDLQAGYWLSGLMPFVGLAYTEDLHRSTTLVGAINDPIGKSALVWSLGVNYYSIRNGVTGGIVYTEENDRTNQNNHNLTANINLRF